MNFPKSFNPGYGDIVVIADSGRTVELAGNVVWYQPAREREQGMTGTLSGLQKIDGSCKMPSCSR